MDKGTKDSTDEVLIALGAVVLLGGGAIAAFFERIIGWLVDYSVLVTGADVVLPIAFGAGLDMVRIVITSSVVVFVSVAAIVAARAWGRRREPR